MRFFLTMLLAIGLLGCSTTDSLQTGTGGSTFEVRGKTYDEVWRAANRTASRSLTIIESNKESGTLKAEKGVGLATLGEVVGIFVKPSRNGAPFYTLEVQSLKRSSMQITGQDWTLTMKSGILAELD